MKLFLKILGILILVIILAMVAIPYFFRDQIVEKVKEEINNNVYATVDFTDFNLSLFRSFPNFNFRLEGLSVVNKAPFEGDTLAFIPEFGLTLDLMSVIRGDAYELRKITIWDPQVNALVNKDGAANWDIAPESDSTTTAPEEQDTGGSAFVIKLRDVEIENARIVYDDKSLATYALLEGVNHKLSGDFTLDYTTLDTYTTISSLTVIYDGIKYLNKVDAELDARIGADLVNYIFKLENNELRLNNLYLGFDGSVGMQDNGDINLMLTYSTKKSEFKNFLSMVPAIYSTDFEGLKTSGTLAISGNVKGIYNDNSYPAFALNLIVQNGYFQYPDLPQAVQDVNINTKVDFPGGDLDNLTVDVSKFKLNMAGNEISANLSVKKPMTDIYLKGAVNGKMDLSKVKEFYPLEEGDQLAGKITSNVSFEGSMSSLEKQKYDEFTFLGSVLVEGLQYTTSMLPKTVNIQKAQLNFSPEYLDLVNFSMNLGKNTFFAKGKIENFIPYAVADGTLTGSLETSSTYLNISDLMPEDTGEETPAGSQESGTGASSADTSSIGVIEVPDNIDFTMTADYKKVIYDDIELNNIKGRLLVKDKAVNLKNLSMNVLDGTVKISGAYDSKNPAEPMADLKIDMDGLGIKDAYNTFGVMEKFAPIAEKTEGTFSTSFTLNTKLDKELMPVYSSMNGGGDLSTSQIIIENVNSVDKLADLLKMPDLKRLQLSPVDLSFEFIDGKVHVKPFDINFQDMTANLGGWTSFDQSINYDLVLTVPRDKFGGAANAVLDNLVQEANKLGTNFSIGDKVNLKATITGTVTDPKVNLLPGEGSGKNMMDDLKKKAQEELRKQKKKLEDEAKKELAKKKAEAKAKADKIIADAEKQANKIIADAQKQVDAINKTAQQSAQQAKEEAQKQADNIMAEAKKKGPLAELAAKKTTEKLLKEADDQADKIVKEAQNKSDDIMQTAKQNAAKVRADAQQRADKLLEENP